MVLPAVLRDPARDPRQAVGRDRARRLDRDPRLPAVARHLARAVGTLPAVVQAILLALRGCMHRAWLARLQAARGHLRHPRAHLHGLLFRVFPGHPAAAGHLRKDQAGTEFNFGFRAGRESVSGRIRMKMQRTIIALTLAGGLGAAAVPAIAQDHDTPTPPRQRWSFAGPFGKYDPAQLQRGFKIYKEVCQACHSIEMLAFRNLADPGGPGFSEAQAAAVASEYKIKDLDDKGEPTERPGRLADNFPPPFPNELAAKAANGGVAPPDMSTLAKARTY